MLPHGPRHGVGPRFTRKGAVRVTDLGALGGNFTTSYGMNNLGQVVGTSTTVPSNGSSHAFMYSDGQMSDLGVLSGFTSGQANAIKDAGQVVGVQSTSSGIESGFLYSNGQMADLGDAFR